MLTVKLGKKPNSVAFFYSLSLFFTVWLASLLLLCEPGNPDNACKILPGYYSVSSSSSDGGGSRGGGGGGGFTDPGPWMTKDRALIALGLSRGPTRTRLGREGDLSAAAVMAAAERKAAAAANEEDEQRRVWAAASYLLAALSAERVTRRGIIKC